jgi:hypothetical protein
MTTYHTQFTGRGIVCSLNGGIMGINCPHCHAESVISGKIYNLIDHVNPPAYFRPDGLPFMAIFNANVPLQNKFFACSFCGLIWSNIDNQKLQRFISSRGAV